MIGAKLLFALGLLTASCHASVVFSSFDIGDTYDFADVDITPPGWLAYQFTVPAGANVNLGTVEIPLSAAAAPRDVDFFLTDHDAILNQPGATLTTFPRMTVLSPQPGAIYTFPPDLPVLLIAGATYWLVMAPVTGEIGWQSNTTGQLIQGAYTFTGAPPWTDFDRFVCFRVNDAPLPPGCGNCGDCDQNGSQPTILDALVAAQIAAGLVTPIGAQTLCCDVDSSLAINVLDALKIAQFAAGLPGVLVCP